MKFTPMGIELAGYAAAACLTNKRTVRLFNEHRRDELQYQHYADDWDEEYDADGWRYAR